MQAFKYSSPEVTPVTSTHDPFGQNEKANCKGAGNRGLGLEAMQGILKSKRFCHAAHIAQGCSILLDTEIHLHNV